MVSSHIKIIRVVPFHLSRLIKADSDTSLDWDFAKKQDGRYEGPSEGVKSGAAGNNHASQGMESVEAMQEQFSTHQGRHYHVMVTGSSVVAGADDTAEVSLAAVAFCMSIMSSS